jgi:hypothetical protein
MLRPKEFVIVYAGTAIEAGFVKSLLESYGIVTHLRDEMMGTIAPWYVAPGGVGAVKVVTSRDSYERAKAIIAEFMDE